MTGRLKIEPGARFVIAAKTYVVSGSRGEICVVHPEGKPEHMQEFGKAELALLWGRTDFSFDPGPRVRPVNVSLPSVNELNPTNRARVLRRLAYVEGYIRLLAATKFLRLKSAKDSARWGAAVEICGGEEFFRTKPSAAAAARKLQPQIDRLGAFIETPKHLIAFGETGGPKRSAGGEKIVEANKAKKPRTGKVKQVIDGKAHVQEFEEPGGGALLDWLAAFEAAGGDPMALKPKYANSGNHAPKLEEEVQALITAELPDYLKLEGLSAERYLENVNTAITRENNRRRTAGEPGSLKAVGIGAIRRVIGQIDPYFHDLCRLGEPMAKAKWGWVQDTITYYVPGQRIEIDAYRCDVMTLMIMSGAYLGLSREQRRKLKKIRMWLTVAIDSATRVILAMRLSTTPDAPNAVSVLEMVESDKSIYSEASECESTWSQRTGLYTVVADGGYISAEMRAAVTDARATIEYPEAGAAYLRAAVERIFRTVATRLMARLAGKTFSDILKRGDYDSEENAGLTIDELAWILVTWVVDIYHNTPHESLGGLTPAIVWEKSADKYDIRPWRDAHGRRTAFGVRLKRVVTSQGIEVLGNFYRDDSSEGLRLLQQVRNTGEVEVMVDVANLGAISIVIGEKAYTLPARDRSMEQVRAADWIENTLSLRRLHSNMTQLPRDVAHRALGRIIDKNRAAVGRASVVSKVYSAADLDYYEQGLFQRIRYADPMPNESKLPLGEPVQALAVTKRVAAPSESESVDAPQSSEPPPEPDRVKSAWKLE